MNCPTCTAEMTVFGCRVSELPFHWCPNCGTLRTCEHDAPFVAPAVLSCVPCSAYLPVCAPRPAAVVGKAIGVTCCEATFATAAEADEHERAHRKPMTLLVDVDWSTMRCPCGSECRTDHPEPYRAWKAEHRPHSNGNYVEHFVGRSANFMTPPDPTIQHPLRVSTNGQSKD